MNNIDKSMRFITVNNLMKGTTAANLNKRQRKNIEYVSCEDSFSERHRGYEFKS